MRGVALPHRVWLQWHVQFSHQMAPLMSYQGSLHSGGSGHSNGDGKS